MSKKHWSFGIWGNATIVAFWGLCFCLFILILIHADKDKAWGGFVGWFQDDWRMQANMVAIFITFLPFWCCHKHASFIKECRKKAQHAIDGLNGSSIVTLIHEAQVLGFDFWHTEGVKIDFEKLKEFSLSELGTILACILPVALDCEERKRLLLSLAYQLIERFDYDVWVMVNQMKAHKATDVAMGLENALNNRFNELSNEAEAKRIVDEPVTVHGGFSEFFTFKEKGSSPEQVLRFVYATWTRLLARKPKEESQPSALPEEA